MNSGTGHLARAAGIGLAISLVRRATSDRSDRINRASVTYTVGEGVEFPVVSHPLGPDPADASLPRFDCEYRGGHMQPRGRQRGHPCAGAVAFSAARSIGGSGRHSAARRVGSSPGPAQFSFRCTADTAVEAASVGADRQRL